MQHFKIWLIVLSLTLSLYGNGFYESAIKNLSESVTKSKNTLFAQLYPKLYYVPIWVGDEGLSYMTKDLFRQIRSDATLSPLSTIYQSLIGIEKLAISIYNNRLAVEQKVALELKITVLYYKYAKHLLYGNINWVSAKAKIHSRQGDWVTHTPPYNPITFLITALQEGELNFDATKPQNFNYVKLEAQVKRYREYQQSGKWSKVSDFGGLKLGSESAALPALRERLQFLGDYDCSSTSSTVADECFENAIKRFQKRHGLIVTGYITKKTKALLIEPIEAKIRKMLLNLDRMKWLPRESYAKHIVINIPAFKLNFYSSGQVIQSMRVITGKWKNPTPIFNDIVTSIVLNPYWNVPASILEKEMIVDLHKNPNYLKRKNMKLYSGWDGKVIDPSTVNWKKYKKGSKIPYRVAQNPGYGNALGKIKFLFPNRFAVYMHDTPTKSLFKRNVRAFSHGCIRLQNPRGLLKTFSNFNSNVNYLNATKTLKGTTRKAIPLQERVPINVVYLTAWVDAKGILNFRNDIYGYDRYQY
ncbi:MAG: L,D-transpeptidase family protein [Campylobacterota bacterium]|nr:L,D-transpeptidase family protein [Campylobacterota bacterium]